MESQIASPTIKRFLLCLNSILLFSSNCAGPMLIRLYFTHGGSRIWLSCALMTAGFPITLIILIIAYLYRRTKSCTAKKVYLTRRTLITCSLSGLITGMTNFFYAYGSSKLPVSTSSLLTSTQLVSTAGFAYFLVKQKFTAYSVNSVVLLTVGAVALAIGAGSDRPTGESTNAYVVGFIMVLASSLLYGFVLPFNEVSFRKTKQAVSFTLALEFQTVMSFFATTVSIVGMMINKDFQAIWRDAKHFDLGEGKYYLTQVGSAVVWQIFFVGAVAVTCYGSALLSGIVIAVSVPATEVLAVFFFHEKFGGEKGLSLALSLWGFTSYFYGEMKTNQKENNKKNENATYEGQIIMTQSHPI